MPFLSHSNIKLAQSLEERDTLVDKLEKKSEDFDRAQTVGNIGSWRLDVCKNELTWSDENHRIFGIPKVTPLTYETFLSTPIFVSRLCSTKKSTIFYQNLMTNTVF